MRQTAPMFKDSFEKLNQHTSYNLIEFLLPKLISVINGLNIYVSVINGLIQLYFLLI